MGDKPQIRDYQMVESFTILGYFWWHLQ